MNTRLHATRQRGLALAVVLILLLVMTLLGLASMRGTLLQERMSASLTDRNLSFQAAEAALRQGEEDARSGLIGWDCRTTADPASPPLPSPLLPCATTFNEPALPWTVATPLSANTATPTYLLEFIASDVSATIDEKATFCPAAVDISSIDCSVKWRVFRITARSQQAGRAGVMLQSIFKVR